MSGERAKKRLELRLGNRLGDIRPALDRIEAFLEQHDAGVQVALRFRLALDELLTNIINHGFPSGGVHEIVLDFSISEGSAVCEVRDPGVPFDPLAVPPPDVDANLEDRPIGGLGIHLVRQTIPDLSYRWENGHNVVKLVSCLDDNS